MIGGGGQKCLGNITIHDDAKVGANAVVISDVPAGSTFIGLAAKDNGKSTVFFIKRKKAAEAAGRFRRLFFTACPYRYPSQSFMLSV